MKKSEILNQLILEIQSNIPAPAGKEYHIEYAPVYGGYRLVLINKETGGHSGCFGGNGTEPRIKFDVMCLKLRTIIATYETINKSK